MAQQSQGRFRRFLQTRLGRAFLIVLAIVVVSASYIFSAIIAIPAIVLFALAIPVWSGLKRPRFLALLGLVVVLAVAPIATAVFTQDIMTPTGPVSSSPGPGGLEMMQNATISPYLGNTSTNFTWTVTVYPYSHPANNSTPTKLQLFISTCPGATSSTSLYCGSGYPLTTLTNKSLPPNATNACRCYNVTFHYRIGSDGIWNWQMIITTTGPPNGTSYYQELAGDPTYDAIQGPIIGGYGATYLSVLPGLYEADLLFLGVPFYLVLLVYMLFKNWERRRKEAPQRALGPVPPTTTPPEAGTTPPAPSAAPLPSSASPPPSGPAGPPSEPSTGVKEYNCPKCNAVVYAGEKSCWKCGAPLPPTSSN